MIPALLIAAFTAVVGLVIYLFELRYRRKNPGEAVSVPVDEPTKGETAHVGTSDEGTADEAEDGEECCGLHLVCEKDSLSPMSDEIVYYDDEELDRFIGRTADSYTPEEEEEFREVLMTLLPSDAAGWARSITQRRLELPTDVRDALLLIVNEQRQSPTIPR